MLRASLRESGAWYVAALLCGPLLYAVVAAAAPDAQLGTMPLSIVVIYTATVVGILLWGLYRPAIWWDGWTRGWLMLGVILWLYTTGMWFLQDEKLSGAGVALPVSFLLILLKRPSASDAWRAADVFAWLSVCAGAVILLLEVTGVIPAWYASFGEVGENLVGFDLQNYWLPFREVLGLEGRWGGYAALPNVQGQAGALLLVYGFARPGVRRVAFVATGAAILLLTDSRTSYAACAVGLILMALLPGWSNSGRKWTPARVIALVLGVMMAARVALKVLADPNLTGRIAMWPDFLSLSAQNPVLGAGGPVIEDAVKAGDLPAWADQGHNILIDTLVRFGVLGLVLALAFLALAVLIGVRGARLGQGISVVLTITLIVSCMGDLGLVWPYPSEGMSVLILAVLLARRTDPEPAREKQLI